MSKKKKKKTQKKKKKKKSGYLYCSANLSEEQKIRADTHHSGRNEDIQKRLV